MPEHPSRLISASRAALLVVDVQERLIPHIHESGSMIAHCSLLLEAARIMGVDAIMCEQYPQGLGPTVPVLRNAVSADRILAKTNFSAARDPALAALLRIKPQVVICGIEAHVCVLQTALDLVERGIETFVVADAVASRAPESRTHALARLRDCGVQVVTAEMAIFEMAERSGTDRFRAISKLLQKQAAPSNLP